MATRIFLPSNSSSPMANNPTTGTWTETTGFVRRGAVTSRTSSAMTDKTQARTASAANNTWLDTQYIIGPLAGQTYAASTIKGTIRALESAANDNVDAMRLLVRVVAPDGTTFRGTIYGPTNGTVAEFNTALRAKRLAVGGATTQVVVTEGDYLVIEIGATATTGGVSISTTINYGDNSATDLGDNETDTAANNPFVELAGNMKFLGQRFAQAQASIKGISRQYGQAQTDIKAKGNGFGQAQAFIAYTSASDLFTRTVSNAFGTADTGGDWSWYSGHSTNDLDTDGSIAQITLPGANNRNMVQLRQTELQNTEVLLKFQIDKIPITNSMEVTSVLRWISDSANYTAITLIDTTPTFSLNFNKAGVGVGSPVVSSLTPTINTWYWVRAQTITDGSGTQVRMKLWVDGTAEPMPWDVDRHDGLAPILSDNGTVGVEAVLYATVSNAPIIYSLDNFSAYVPTFNYQFPAYAQAQADIKAKSNAPAQAQADIKAVRRGFGQAQAMLDGLTYARDSFTRTLSNSLGTADVGGDWNGASNFDIDGSKVTSNLLSSGFAILGKTLIGNTDTQIKVLTSNVEASPGFYLLARAQFTESNGPFSNIYYLETNLEQGGTGLSILTIKNGVETNLGSGGSGVGDNDTFIYLRLQVVTEGANVRLRARAWVVGTQEPSVWHVNIVDSTNPILLPGHVGFGADTGDSTIAVFDDFNAQTYIPAGFGQAQAKIAAGATVTYGHAQAQADIKATNNAFAQSQADIKAIGRSFAQAQADIKATVNSFAQSQADIKATLNSFAQSQADIKAVGRSFAQSQADIKAVGNGFGQTQADIKATNRGFAQAQATIRGNAFAQAQADIKAVGYAFGQARADIKATGRGFAQSQADIKAKANSFAQAQSDIKAVGQSYGQAQAGIKATGFALAQAGARIAGGALVWIQDTFTRTLSGTLGTPDIGPPYIIEDAPAFSIDGNKLIVTDDGPNIGLGAVSQISAYSADSSIEFTIPVPAQPIDYFEVDLDLRYKSDPFVSVYTNFYNIFNGDLSQVQLFLQAISLDPDELVNQSSSTDNPITLSFDTTYILKLRVKDGKAYSKIWQKDTNEPDWQLTINAPISKGGSAKFVAQASDFSGDTPSIYIDNYNVSENINAGLGQAQADIKAIGRGFAQAGARIRGDGALVWVKDTFTRTNASSWETPDIGPTYEYSQIGVPATDGSTGTIDSGSHQIYSPIAATNIDSQLDFIFTDEGRTSSYVEIGGRADFGLNQSWVGGYVNGSISIPDSMFLGLFNGGANQSFIPIVIAFDIWYTLKVRINGTMAYAKVWERGQIEPDWMVKIEPDAPNLAGGAYVDIVHTTTFNRVHVDNYNVTEVLNERSGQANADIKATGYGFAQSQADIKAVGRGFGQAQAAIKGNSFAQAQADIKAIYQSYAQAQAKINAKGVNSFAQANAQIFGAVQQYAQAQADIKAKGNSFAQSQADIKAKSNSFAQAQADILRTVNAHAQAQADIEAVGNSFAQSQADIKAKGNSFAQSQADIKAISRAFAQAQADIKVTSRSFAQTQATIITTRQNFAQAQADIEATSISVAQAQGSIKTVYNSSGQAQADIKHTYTLSAQAQAYIQRITQTFAQAQADIKVIFVVSGQAQADIRATNTVSANAQASIKATVNNYGQAQASIITIKARFGQAQAQISSGAILHAQANALILRIELGHAQVNALIIKAAGYGQAQAFIHQPHELKKLVTTDIATLGTLLDDEADIQILEEDSKHNKLHTSDERAIKLRISDTSIP